MTFSVNSCVAFGSNDSTIHSSAEDEHRRERREQPQPDAGGQADRQRRQHDAGILGVVDLGAVAHQPRGADDAERAREAGADDQHHDRADDGEDDLRLDDRRLALRRAAAPRPEREHARQAGGDRQPRQRVLEIADLFIERRGPFEDVGCASAARSGSGCASAGIAAAGERDHEQQRADAVIAARALP